MKFLASILTMGLAVAGALADSTEVDAQYFHPAASLYIQGDTASASNLVAKGLSIHPDDGKLKRLKELLEKQQEQQQDQENKDDQQQNQEQQQDDPEEQGQPPPPEQEQTPEQEQPPEKPEPQSAEQMSKDEAEQLLDAMRQEEKNKRLQLHPVMGAPVKVDKDW